MPVVIFRGVFSAQIILLQRPIIARGGRSDECGERDGRAAALAVGYETQDDGAVHSACHDILERVDGGNENELVTWLSGISQADHRYVHHDSCTGEECANANKKDAKHVLWRLTNREVGRGAEDLWLREADRCRRRCSALLTSIRHYR